MNRRDVILNASARAAEVAAQFRVPQNRRSYDIVGTIVRMGIPLQFQPLKKLWGAAVRMEHASGILVTSVLPLSVQRFTAAHELGHVLLHHQTVLDKELLMGGHPESTPLEELAADTFASALLAPKGRIISLCREMDWARKDLHEPARVYQLALRLGLSYAATYWALSDRGIIGQEILNTLRATTPKELKKSVSGGFLKNPWADVWDLSMGDSGRLIEAGPDDVFRVALPQHSGGGYLWELEGENAKILQDSSSEKPNEVGAPTTRVAWFTLPEAGVYKLAFREVRPWSGDALNDLVITVDDFGKEGSGMSRFEQQTLMELAATA